MVKTKTPPPGMKVCDRCGGDAFVEYEEDGRPVRDACYHCGNTGFITDEQAYLDRIEHVAESLAIDAVQKMRQERNDNSDAFGGEDWAFCAAENGLHEYEYTQGKVWEYTGRMMGVFKGMKQKEPSLLRALIDRLSPLPKESPAPEPDLSEQPPPEPEEVPPLSDEESDVPDGWTLWRLRTRSGPNFGGTERWWECEFRRHDGRIAFGTGTKREEAIERAKDSIMSQECPPADPNKGKVVVPNNDDIPF